MNQVRIYHPALRRFVAVPESAVPMHRNAGWILADEVDTEPAGAADAGTAATQDTPVAGTGVPENTDGGEPEDPPAKDTPARGRRQPKE